MSRSLIGGLLRGGTALDSICVVEPNMQARESMHSDFGIAVFDAARAAPVGVEAIVLAVKPQVLKSVCVSLRSTMGMPKPLIISIAAGIRIAQIESWLGGATPIIRCMPNTPALIGAGASALYATSMVSTDQRALAQNLFDAVGISRWLDDEALIDTVTALSGSGPAYFFLFAEALEAAAVVQGLPRDIARALVAQTFYGAGRMLIEADVPAATLRARVTSPNGTTQAALESFATNDLSRIVAQAVSAATQRGVAMSRQFDD